MKQYYRSKENHQYRKTLLSMTDFVQLKTFLYIANTCKQQRSTVNTTHDLLYKLAESQNEQIKRLMVVIHHETIHELASSRFLKLNLECENIKIGRITYEDLFFSFMRLCSKSPSCNRVPQLFLSLQSFLKKQLL